MRFIESKLKGAYLIEIEKLEDERGFFGRAWCCDEFEKMGLNADIKQINTSFSPQKGTLRGLHYQIDPYQEVKFIRCTQGRIFDVIVDLRPASPTFLQWDGYELGAENGRMMYVPEHFATGFITLEDDCAMYYPTTQAYVPGAERGIRYDDPVFGIEWPVETTVVSEKDRGRPDFDVNNFES
jgi:dTDP-4-dehydrorhamnose 3,5-epimerase